MDTDTLFLFPPFRLDVHNEQLWDGTQVLALRPKTFAVLRVLVAQAGQLVTQDALLDAVWGPTAVSEAVVRRSIRELRAILGDTAQHPQFIQTVHRRGYRFIAPVTVADTPNPVRASAMEGSHRAPLPTSPESTVAVYPPTGLPLDEEYKVVTVLCCAVPDAPTLAVQRGPEAMHRLMQALFAIAEDVMRRYDATITHVTGEGFTAVFGAPVGQEDHARRAVLAGFELSQYLRAHSLGVAHAPVMGLHTGPVVVGHLASTPERLYTASGDTIHQASQLQRLAPPRTILMSTATHRLVQDEVRVEAFEMPALEGGGKHLAVYTVQGLTQRRAGVAGQGTRHRSRFVGREQELTLLHERLAHVVQGHGQVIGIAGEAGIGKSRLLAEFHRSLAGQPVTYREGHCLSYGSSIPYLPVRDLLRQGWSITDTDGVESIIAKVHQHGEEAHLRPEDDVPLLLQLLDVPMDDTRLARFSPQERKMRLFVLLRHLMLHDSQHQPLVLAVENLHWVDASSAEWFTTLVEHLAGAAILLLVTHRPGYQPPWLARAIATQMALPQLLPPESLTVVQSVLQTTTVPPPLLQTLLSRAAGNPFFLEELTWAVLEAQRRHLALPELPETIQAVLAARLDHLPPVEKRLIQTAAVLGTEVALPLLQTIAELPGEVVHQALAHLQSADLLYETRLVPERMYTFKHALTQEVAYQSLLHERQRALHTHVVVALETQYPDRLTEHVDRLAHHALRGAVWAKAVTYCRQAGQKALARSAYHEAMGYFEQALSALVPLPETRDTRAQAIDLRLALGSALLPLGRWEHLLAALREAEALAVALDDLRRLGQVSVYLSASFYFRGAYDQATASGQRALTLATAAGDGALQVLAQQRLGAVSWAQGDYHRAIEYYRQAVASLDVAPRHERFGQVLLPPVNSRTHLAVSHAELGTFAEGRARGEEGLQIAETAEHPASIMFASWGVGLLALRQGDLPKALPLLERAVGLCQDTALPSYFPRMAPALGAAYMLGGRVADAVLLLTQVLEQTTAMAIVHFESFCRLSLGEAHLRAGRLEAAHALAEHALALAREHQERGHEAYALCLLGDIAARRDLPASEPAVVYYQQALTLAEELGMRPLQAHCNRSLGTVHSWIGRVEQARAALTTAIDLYRAMDMTFWLPQAEEALAQVEGWKIGKGSGVPQPSSSPMV